MRFSCINKVILDQVYIHDAQLSEIKFDNNQKILNFVLDKIWREGMPSGVPYKKYAVAFYNVLGFQMNTYSPWGTAGGRIRGWANGADYANPVTTKIFQEWKENSYTNSDFSEEDAIVEIGLEMSSGDVLLVACESIEVYELLPDGTLSDQDLLWRGSGKAN